MHATGATPVFVAVSCGQDSLWYGKLILCFNAQYFGQEPLCYLRWLTTVQMRAAEERRPLTRIEAAGPFEAFKWSKCPGSRRAGHPRAGMPHFGVVSLSQMLYRAPLRASNIDALDEPDPLWRLNH